MNPLAIEPGDLVYVEIKCATWWMGEALVISLPRGCGDSWVFKESGTDRLYYISEGCTVRLLKKKAQ